MRSKKYCLRLRKLEKKVEELEHRLSMQQSIPERTEKNVGISTGQLLNEWMNGEETAHE